MKTVFPWIISLILVGVCVYLWNSQEAVYLPGDIIYDTLRIENPINKKLELQAEKSYYISVYRLRKIDSLRAVIDGLQGNTTGDNNFIAELVAIITRIEGEKDSLAKAKFKIGEYEGEIVYKFKEEKFEVDYKKLFEVYARERIPGVEFGVSCYLWKQKDYGVKLGGMIGFPKLIKDAYIGIAATSFGGFGAGINYIF